MGRWVSSAVVGFGLVVPGLASAQTPSDWRRVDGLAAGTAIVITSRTSEESRAAGEDDAHQKGVVPLFYAIRYPSARRAARSDDEDRPCAGPRARRRGVADRAPR